MTENMSENEAGIWKKLLRRHWGAAVLVVLGIILAAIGAVLVYLWYVGQAQLSGLVPSSLGGWTIGNVVAFLLHLAFWELIIIGIPVIAAAIVSYLWWKRLPAEEREEYRRAKLFGNRSRRSSAGNGFSFLVFIVFLLKVYLDGNWNTPLSSWTFDYLVYSGLWAFIAIAIVFGIPLLIIGLWWLRRQMRHTP